jgi:TM2 domain-containing membrane protein YozV
VIGAGLRKAAATRSRSGKLNGMTDPSQRGVPQPGWQGPPPAGGYPPPYPPYPAPAASADPAAPYGRHPVTGEPLSDRSKILAGLLQLIGVIGIAGIGRIYLGYTGLGIAQLIVGLATCGIGAVVWGIIDAVLILTGQVRDPRGRPLRDEM